MIGENACDISVVIPTHKRHKELERAVNSAFSQTFQCNQIIVVSDGFDQKTDELMKRLVSEHSSIQYQVIDPPQGGNHARNVGADLANTAFIAFLDDDDEWHPQKVERQMELFQEDGNIGVVCSAMNIIEVDNGISRVSTPMAKYDSSRMILFRNCIGSTSSVIVRKSIFVKSGMFDEQLKAMQDYELWIRICQFTKIGVVKEPCVDYYNDANSAQISSNTQKYIDAYDYIFDKHKELFHNMLNRGELRTRKTQSFLAISKRAMRNGQPALARDYAKRALRFGALRGMLYYALSLSSYRHFTRIKARISKMH